MAKARPPAQQQATKQATEELLRQATVLEKLKILYDPNVIRTRVELEEKIAQAKHRVTEDMRREKELIGVADVERLARDLHEQIDAMVAIARRHADDAGRHQRIADDLAALYVARAAAHGCTFEAVRVRELLAMDIELNAQGLEVWLDRSSKAA